MMTNKAVIAKLILKYKNAFSNAELPPDKLKVYTELLQDIPMDNLEKAIIECAKTRRFFPTVSEIREEAKKFSADNDDGFYME